MENIFPLKKWKQTISCHGQKAEKPTKTTVKCSANSATAEKAINRKTFNLHSGQSLAAAAPLERATAVATLPAEYKEWLNDETIDKRTKVIIEDNSIVILSGSDDKEVFKFKDAKFSKGVWEIVAESGEILTLKEEKGEFILHTDFCDYKLTKQ